MARSHWLGLGLGLEGCPVNGNGMAWHGVVSLAGLRYAVLPRLHLPFFLFLKRGRVEA